MTRITRFCRPFAAAAVAATLALAVTPGAMANDTVAVKNALYGAGYQINNVSPNMDDATRKALEKFQSDAGLNSSGVLDDATKEALGMVSVQVAAAPQNSGSASQSAASDTSASASAESSPEVQAKQEDVEEKDDGGWSFF